MLGHALQHDTQSAWSVRPPTAAEDAAHVAIAAMQFRIEHVCQQTGYALPVICAPNELLEFDHGGDSV